MSTLKVIQTPSAPQAIGPYSQAIAAGNLVFLSGQIPLDPATMELVEGDVATQATQVFKNLNEVVTAAGGLLNQIAKLTIYLTDLNEFANVNSVMANHFAEPYPARATVEVSGLPKGAAVEVDAILVL
jgi:reactive intermediate/imine deaminase